MEQACKICRAFLFVFSYSFFPTLGFSGFGLFRVFFSNSVLLELVFLQLVFLDSVFPDSVLPILDNLGDSIYDLKTFSAAAYRVNTIWSTGIVVLLEVLSNTIRQMMMGLAETISNSVSRKIKEKCEKEIFAATSDEREKLLGIVVGFFQKYLYGR